MTRILAFSGRKEAGKSTLADFVLRNAGEWWGKDKVVQTYAMADTLKEVCVNLLGLSPEQVCGTNEQKDSLTHILWENLPHYPLLLEQWNKDFFKDYGEGCYLYREDVFWTKYGRRGPMTGRQVMQEVGTGIFRRMWSNCHIHATLNRIAREKPFLALLTDIRMPNEVYGLQKGGGKVIRLTRNPHGDADRHESEIALDRERFDWADFDAILDNKHLTLGEQNRVLITILRDFGWLGHATDLLVDH